MKRKLAKILAATFIAAAMGSVVFGGCDLLFNKDKNNSGEDNNGQQPAPPADPNDPSHRHALSKVDEKPSTCTSKGNIAYWFCTGCNTCFSDGEGENIIAENSVYLDYADHTYVDGVCEVCGDRYIEGGSLSELCNGSYGYSTLDANGKQFYDGLEGLASAFHNEGNAQAKTVSEHVCYVVGAVNYINCGLTFDEASQVLSVFRADKPLYYWISSTYLNTSREISLVVEPEYRNESARAATNALLYEKIEQFLSAAKSSDDAYHKTLAFHDAIVDYIDYAYSSPGVPQSKSWAHSIEGVFLNGVGDINGAVCEGYAKAFQLLLNVSGINNIFVSGWGFTSDGGEAHAWNAVEIGGKYYWYDLTWDDQPLRAEGKIYDYFCKPGYSSGEFAYSHRPNVTANGNILVVNKLYDLPENRFASDNYSGTGVMYTRYTSNGFTYVVSGYNTVQLISCTRMGAVTVPENVTLDGREYSVKEIGTVYADKNTLSRVFALNTTTVSLPKTVSFIWDLSFNVGSLTAITVDAENAYFTSLDGVLYTKNKYTLVAYPANKSGSTYTVDSATKIIAYASFDSCRLSTLVVGPNTTVFYLDNKGKGYYDDEASYVAAGSVDGMTVAEFKQKSGIRTVQQG